MLTLNTDKLLCRVEAGICRVTFNNPDHRSAMTLEMWRALGDAVHALHADATVRVVVLTGARGKAFVAGAHISEFEQHRASSAQLETWRRRSRTGARSEVLVSSPLNFEGTRASPQRR